ncbi:DUF4267 domain-containing protein [Mucilaginibacter sp. BT774]|uniref:DUF4267 domain-containing protein n=1 Tax=Mucilaginibacter sp. BT774 TaxID=3062276 RepID=UPI002676E7E8|nr:DUF4267 domain-containing protein [Mucilaginibacter sp. BT774]MDO3629103.1 DUF4267 domain-containing protein [Mucilaginibacter sp. BT774]
MKTINQNSKWGANSASFWMTLLVAAGIIFVGIRFIVNPHAGAIGFGINFSSDNDIAFGRIKGIRDIFSGLVLLPLLFFEMRRATAWVFTAAIIIPATDCLIVLATNGPSDTQHLLIHGLTALYMAVTSFLLFRNKTQVIY